MKEWSITESVAPAEEPVTLTEAKSHLKVEVSADDTLITAMIEAARIAAEEYCHRAFVERTLILTLDSFPLCNVIYLPYGICRSVTSVQYVDSDGVTQTLSSSLYRVDTKSAPGRITPAYNESWPTIRNVIGAVTVTYKAGDGADASEQDELTKLAINLTLTEMYENRGETVMGSTVVTLPNTSKVFLNLKRVFGVYS